MNVLVWIALGGGIGSVLRYLIAVWLNPSHNSLFPFGTLTVNVVGCYLIGLCSALLSEKFISPHLSLFLMTGLLGGFTTFSSLGLESVELFKQALYGKCVLYILLTHILGMCMVYAGVATTKWITG